MYVRFDIDNDDNIVILGQLCDPFRDSKNDSLGRAAQIDAFLNKAHDTLHLSGPDFVADCQSVAHGVDDEELDFHLHLAALYWQLPADEKTRRQKRVASVFSDYFGRDAKMEKIQVGGAVKPPGTRVFDVFRMLCTVPEALLRSTAMDYCRRIARTPRYHDEQPAIRLMANTRLNLIRAIDDLQGASDELKAFLREAAWTRKDAERCGIFVQRVQKVAAAQRGLVFLSALMQRLPKQHGAWAVRDLDVAARAIGLRAAASDRDLWLLGRYLRRFREDEQVRYLQVVFATQDAIHRHADLGAFTETARGLMPKVAAWPTVLRSEVLIEAVRDMARSHNPRPWGGPLDPSLNQAALHRAAHDRWMASLWAMDLLGMWSDGNVAKDNAEPFDTAALVADMTHGDPWHAWSAQDIADVIEVGLRTLGQRAVDCCADIVDSVGPIELDRLRAIEAALAESSSAFTEDRNAALEVRSARALLARVQQALATAWAVRPESETSRSVRSRIFEAIRNGLPNSGFSYGSVAGIFVSEDVSEPEWLACRAGLQDCWIPGVKQIVMPVAGTDTWAPQPLGPAQALGLDVGPRMNPGPEFKIRVTLWRRRRGTLALPSSDAAMPQRMDRRSWYDTGVPCYEFYVKRD